MKEIPRLADKIARRYYEIPKEERNGKCQITTSTSFFIPKPFTPFQWARMYSNKEYIARAAIVKHEFQEQLNRKSLKYNWHDAETTVLEGVLARVLQLLELGAADQALFGQGRLLLGLVDASLFCAHDSAPYF